MADTGYAEGSYLTILGGDVIAKALAMKTGIKYTRVAVGDGELPDGVTPSDMTELVNFKRDAIIASIDNPGTGEVSLGIQVSSVGVDVGFFVREIGLWADDPDTGDVLYAYVSLADKPVWIRPNGTPINSMVTFKIHTIVASVQIVSAVINPDAFITYADLDKYALKGHVHEIDHVIGLRDILNSHQDDIELLKDLISGDMPGGIYFAADFYNLTNVRIISGWLDRSANVIRA